MRIIALFLTALAVLSLPACLFVNTGWEYRVLPVPAEALMPDLPESADRLLSKRFEIPESLLNSLGKEGWELVGTIPEVETVHPNFGNSDYVTGLQPNVRSSRVTLIFKRRWTGKPSPSASPSPAK